MTKIKVKDLANEVGSLPSEVVEQINSEFGLNLQSVTSLIDEEVADKVRQWLKERAGNVRIEEKRVASRVIRRRRVAKPDEPEREEIPTVDVAASPEEEAGSAEAIANAGEEANANAAEASNQQEATRVDGERKRKSAFKKLAVVEERDLPTPVVKDAPPDPTAGRSRKSAAMTPEQMAMEMARAEGDKPRERSDAGKSIGRREVIEVREIIRRKPYGKRKATSKKGKKTEITTPKASKRVIKVSESITISELARRMGLKATELIGKAMGMGLMVTINQSIDADTAAIVASEFGYEVENVAIDVEEMIYEEKVENIGDASSRPPVVTIMGHVDHGKTSLLDYIRRSEVVDSEHGGITQHIGAYDVHHDKGHIIFLDTPGHAAFTAMRARGASITDIVILVIAADDGVMPQTKEAVNHAKDADVPIIVAINKMDRPEANPEKVKQELTEIGLIPEEWGGDAIFVPVSAKSGEGVSDLLDMIILQTEVMELKAFPQNLARGVIIESKLDKGRGAVATVLVQDGTLGIGDSVVCGSQSGKIRALVNDRGDKVKEAGPSIPVEVVGLSGVVTVGDTLNKVRDEKKARQISMARQEKQRQKDLDATSRMSLDQLYTQIQKGEVKDLKLIVKGDVMGSLEAIREAIGKITHEQVSIQIIHDAVGGISESDIMLASASNAIVIGFSVRPEPAAQALAEKEQIDIRLYNVIYDVVDDIRGAVEGLLSPKTVENVVGRFEVRETFNITKVGTIGGGQVTDGKISRSSKVRLIRDSVVVHNGTIASLRRFKDDVREVQNGYECGISIENYNDLKIGDIIEAYELKEIKQELSAQ